ncbi:hypothetical protein T4B_9904 [Trichinella pseudospiralis]|uniref:Uncharacterized protein n=2 Tax=Trichinella pseudospiralis TaxID=6337 RepID=A0A0V1E4Q3_TRIPS|nr:hypothetical protein T4A_12526 [Trichinella pseudospiralis]KRY87009.1 hypothetical protein T4D_12269 [Trichinella pseudospiralis]KRZ00367.1 hypothetical protein T4B_10887 [Trichinella pseudospiralis]KRZ05595.1 hypothetical protein T4B_9904 [Trichinella pseudospiralis]KRZ35537.1 hypothetical protein T4C_4307 [Trichinella pseudospiralis]
MGKTRCLHSRAALTLPSRAMRLGSVIIRISLQQIRSVSQEAELCHRFIPCQHELNYSCYYLELPIHFLAISSMPEYMERLQEVLMHE